MTTTTKQMTTVKTAPNWRAFTATAAQKIGENILDMVVTIASLGILMAYLIITQPLAAIEYGGYIIAVYIILMLRRIVHDFDESWTTDEIGDRIATVESKIEDLTRMVRDDIITDEEIMQRLEKVS